MMKNRTFNTLFIISSVDGKISTGSTDNRDVDKDFPNIKGVKEGLHQYYELEQKTDYYSLNTGRVMNKIGINGNKCPFPKMNLNFIIIDNKHLTKKGITNLTNNLTKVFIITTNKKHPAFNTKNKNIEVICYNKKINFSNLFLILKSKYKVNKITVQSGGTLNSVLIREGLIDRLSLVIAPVLIGGKDTSTLIDGKSLISDKDLKQIKALKLKSYKKLKNSYIHLVYDVLN